jgi:hypothetical protein
MRNTMQKCSEKILYIYMMADKSTAANNKTVENFCLSGGILIWLGICGVWCNVRIMFLLKYQSKSVMLLQSY